MFVFGLTFKSLPSSGTVEHVLARGVEKTLLSRCFLSHADSLATQGRNSRLAPPGQELPVCPLNRISLDVAIFTFISVLCRSAKPLDFTAVNGQEE